MFVDVQNVMNF